MIKDGWYITGDIAIRDQEGFVTITDRMSRFSKIGGEMVPHIKIEELIQEVVGTEEADLYSYRYSHEKKGREADRFNPRGHRCRRNYSGSK